MQHILIMGHVSQQDLGVGSACSPSERKVSPGHWSTENRFLQIFTGVWKLEPGVVVGHCYWIRGVMIGERTDLRRSLVYI